MSNANGSTCLPWASEYTGLTMAIMIPTTDHDTM